MSTPANEPLGKLVKLLYIVIALVAVVFVLPKAVSCLLPFILAWIISLIIRPFVSLFEKLRINKRFSVILSMLLVLCVLSVVVYHVSGIVIDEVKTFAGMLGDTRDGIPEFVWDIIDVLPENFRGPVVAFLSGGEADFSDMLVPAITKALPKLGGAAGKVPAALIFTVVFLMAIYFLSYDESGLRRELKKVIPERHIDKMRNVRSVMVNAFGGYVKAQLIIMSVVFTILLLGFVILDVELALLLAFIISLVDAIPVLGTGMVLNPMAVVYLIQGDYVRALGFVIMYVIILLVRNFLEPRVLSGQLGMHPIITLISMYSGFKLIGVMGMIIGPLIALIILSFVRMNKEA